MNAVSPLLVTVETLYLVSLTVTGVHATSAERVEGLRMTSNAALTQTFVRTRHLQIQQLLVKCLNVVLVL